MSHVVLKSFPYAEDGMNSEHLAVDAVVVVDASVVESLIKGGYLREATAEEIAAAETGEAVPSKPAGKAKAAPKTAPAKA